MLDYEWENQSTFMFPSDQTAQETDQNNNQFLDPHAHFSTITTNYQQHEQQQQQQQIQNQQFPQFQATPSNTTHFSNMYDPRTYGVSYTQQTHETSLLSLQPTGSSSTGFMAVPKREPQFLAGGIHDFSSTTSRIGLNLGGRTYFASSSDDDFVNRLYRRTRAVEAGSLNTPKCQAEGCNADLTHAKHYHRRHKVCEFHSKAATVIAAGLTQRFCQQCSRFHVLSEFDNGKRSCRKRLADHNRRRRKNIQQETIKKQPLISKSGSAHSSSTVTVAISPSRISVDCFRQRTVHDQQAATNNFIRNLLLQWVIKIKSYI